MDSPSLAPQILLSPFYSNDSLTPVLTISLAPKPMILYSPVQPGPAHQVISNPRPLAQRTSVFLYLSLCLEFMLMDDDDDDDDAKRR